MIPLARQKQEPGPSVFQGLRRLCACMNRKIVEDDDVTGLKLDDPFLRNCEIATPLRHLPGPSARGRIR